MPKPWRGPHYQKKRVKILVLGESRYDEEFADHEIIKSRIEGELKGGQRRTFTNFERAILGQDHSAAEMQELWNSAMFYNYNISFFPGQPRAKLAYRKREDPKNASSLRKILDKFKPTHVIVWGITNWDSIDVGSEWTDGYIPGTKEPYCTTTFNRHTTFFTRVCHPAAGFSSKRWAPVPKRFLGLRP